MMFTIKSLMKHIYPDNCDELNYRDIRISQHYCVICFMTNELSQLRIRNSMISCTIWN